MKKRKLSVAYMKRRSLRFSVVDGSFWAMMVGFGETFFSAFAIFLNATVFQLGLLTSLPSFLGSWSQVFSLVLLRFFKKRKTLILIGVFLQSLMFIGIASVYFLGTFRVFHLIFFVCLYYILGMILNPIWSSWITDLVDADSKGRYFGFRNKVTGFTLMFATLMAGFILQRFGKGTKAEYTGFLIIFSIALISRWVSFYYLSKAFEPRFKPTSSGLSFIEFLHEAKFTNFRTFVFFISAMYLAVSIGSAFFTVYILKDLKYDYLRFTIIIIVALIAKYASMPVWGKISDRYGNLKIMTICSFGISFILFLFLFSTEFRYILLIQIFSGLVWAGFELSIFNFIFESSTHDNRVQYFAYSNIFNGTGIFLGGLLAVLLIRFNIFFWSDYLFLFFISAVLRLLVSIYFIPKLKEIRKRIKEIKTEKIIINVVKETPILLFEDIMSFTRIKK